jgi:RHS repeat-associated protein
VSYTHAGGVDRPLLITKNGTSVVPHQNWRGMFAEGTNPAGQLPMPDIDWPGYHTTPWHGATRVVENWFGSLSTGMRDASGQMYMRNRYYDPASGQFTQPDPIGLAGGLNSYGFAAGDPVTYSDPYGLCPVPPTNCADAAMAVGSVGKFIMAPSVGTGIDAALDVVGALPGVPSVGVIRRVVGAADDVADAGRRGGEVLSRLGTSRESASRLARKAAEAEERIGIHGVSVTAGRPSGPASSATRSSVEAHFRVHNTGRPPHRTVELPKPVTNEVAGLFNRLFGRQ